MIWRIWRLRKSESPRPTDQPTSKAHVGFGKTTTPQGCELAIMMRPWQGGTGKWSDSLSSLASHQSLVWAAALCGRIHWQDSRAGGLVDRDGGPGPDWELWLEVGRPGPGPGKLECPTVFYPADRTTGSYPSAKHRWLALSRSRAGSESESANVTAWANLNPLVLPVRLSSAAAVNCAHGYIGKV